MTLKALIFDFDGLILDTETPDYLLWKNIYQESGFDFPMTKWRSIIGGNGASDFEPAEELARLSQGRLDSVSLRVRHHLQSNALILSQPILPGVEEVVRAAKTMNLKLAIASSSPHSWVDGHMKRLGIFGYFDAIICSDDVAAGRTKPNPDLFLLALNRLQVRNTEAVVFEDSPNGIKAARAAGIFVVAVPNPTTALLDVSGANLKLKSLSDLSLKELAGMISENKTSR